MIVKYEVLLLMRSDLTKEKQDEVKEKLEGLVQEDKGSIISYDRWGKYLLAYEIEKCAYGIYSLLRFSIPKTHVSAVLEKINSLCAVRYNAVIMRFFVVKLPVDASAEYRRPDSLEDAPRRDRSYDFDESWSGQGKIQEKTIVSDHIVDIVESDEAVAL